MSQWISFSECRCWMACMGGGGVLVAWRLRIRASLKLERYDGRYKTGTPASTATTLCREHRGTLHEVRLLPET
jgi:hypothetical protein